MQKTRKLYTDILTTLNMRLNHSEGSLTSYTNKLLRLAYSTEDAEIKEPLLAYARMYSEAYIYVYNGHSSIMFTRNRDNAEVINATNGAVARLKDRINDITNCKLALEKPEWQILALKNGWVYYTKSMKEASI